MKLKQKQNIKGTKTYKITVTILNTIIRTFIRTFIIKGILNLRISSCEFCITKAQYIIKG